MTTASAMPSMAKRFPRSADLGCESPLIPRMKRIVATRYIKAKKSGVRSVSILLFLLEHREHPIGHDEAAKNVDRRQKNSQEAQHRDHQIAPARLGSRHEQGADDDNRADRVGHGHERSVKRGRHAPD